MKVYLTFDVERDWHGGEKEYSRYNLKMEPIPKFSMIENALPEIQKLLNKEKIKATFFVTGEVVENVPELIEDLLSDDHEIGVHTHPYAHPDIFKGSTENWYTSGIWDELSRYNFKEKKEMIKKDITLVKKTLKVKPASFRAGRLKIDFETIKILHYFGIKYDSSMYFLSWKDIFNIRKHAVFFNFRSLINEIPINLDKYTILTKTKVISKIFGYLNILIHPMPFGNAKLDVEQMYYQLREFIELCKKKKYSFKRISE